MKKFLLIALLACVGSGLLADAPAQKKSEPEEWDFIACTFVPGVPDEQDAYAVNGIKFGLPVGVGVKPVSGVELSFFASMSKEINGLQSAVLFNDAVKVRGVQATFGYNYAKDVSGLQLAVVNVAEERAFQIGILNFIKKSPLCCFPFINVRF